MTENYKYIVLNLSELGRRLAKFDFIKCFWLHDCCLNRTNETEDMVCLFGLAKFVKAYGKQDNKLILKCENVLEYDRNCFNNSITLKKHQNFNIGLFSIEDNDLFEEVCELTFKYCVQETDKDGFEERLGPEIGEEITNLIKQI